MSKQLRVVNVEYSGGISGIGTKIKLSDGSYLTGISFVETTVGMDQSAEMLIRLTPDFESRNETTKTQAEATGTENTKAE